MGYKCSPQLKGLVREFPKPGQKHRANGLKIAQEAGCERYSKSITLDRTRSKYNVYQGFRSGGKCWDAMVEDAESYRVKGKTKNGKEFERALRHDAVIGFSIIFHPPVAMCEGWTDEEYERFYRDSFTVMGKIEPRLFREDNIRMTAEHYDESLPNNEGEYGRHVHRIGDCKDENGNYCGNLIDAKLCANIALQYPAMMRDLGWDLDDLDVTDWKRYGEKDDNGDYVNKEYRLERQLRWQKSGRSVNNYIADTAKELNAKLQRESEELERIGELYEDAKQDRVHAASYRKESLALRDAARADAKKLIDEAKEVLGEAQNVSKGQLSEDEAEIAKSKFVIRRNPDGTEEKVSYYYVLQMEKERRAKENERRQKEAERQIEKVERKAEPKPKPKQEQKPKVTAAQLMANQELQEELWAHRNQTEYQKT